MADSMLTPKQVAERLNVSRSFVYGLINRKELNAIRMGKLYRIAHGELERYMQQHDLTPAFSRTWVPKN